MWTKFLEVRSTFPEIPFYFINIGSLIYVCLVKVFLPWIASHQVFRRPRYFTCGKPEVCAHLSSHYIPQNTSSPSIAVGSFWSSLHVSCHAIKSFTHKLYCFVCKTAKNIKECLTNFKDSYFDHTKTSNPFKVYKLKNSWEFTPGKVSYFHLEYFY